jgi:hypothetical protein
MSQEERERVLKGQEQTRPIAERLEEGVARHESVSVYFRDGKQHLVEVYTLSSRQFRQATKKSGLSPRELAEIGNEAKKTEELNKEAEKAGKPPVESPMSDQRSDKIWDFFQELAAASVKEPADILDRLLPQQEATIALKAVEMSQPPKNLPPS